METNLYSSTLTEKLGGGSYGSVFKGQLKTDEDKLIAVKRIENDGEFFTDNAQKEINTLLQVSGRDNIIQLLDIHTDQHFIYIIMEYCNEGDLQDYLKNNADLPYRQKADIMLQCAEGVQYLHGLKPPVVHRDIKTNNILLNRKPNLSIEVKICDFGLSKVFDSLNQDINNMLMSTDVGALAFRAPELFRPGRKQYTASVDIFALGLVYAVIVNYSDKYRHPLPHTAGVPMEPYLSYGQRLFIAHNEHKPAPELYFHTTSSDAEADIISLIKQMTVYDGDNRSHITEIIGNLKPFILVCAIQLGVTGCGYAYSFKTDKNNVIMNKNWGADMGYSAYTAPTSILIDNNNQFVAFGHEAEKRFADRDNLNDGNYHLFSNFTAALHRRNMDQDVLSEDGLPLQTIIIMTLRYMKKHFLDAVNQQSKSEINEDLIKWVILSPSENPQAKEFLKNAALQVQMSKCIVVTEAEAVLQFCTGSDISHGDKPDIRPMLVPGAKFLIVNGANCTTLDGYEVASNNHQKKVSIVTIGNQQIEDNFMHKLRLILGSTNLDSFMCKYPDKFSLMKMGFLRSIYGRKNYTAVDVLWTMDAYFREKFHKDIPEVVNTCNIPGVKFENGVIVIDHDADPSPYKPVTDEVCAKIEEILRRPDMSGCQIIFATGKFAVSGFLRSALKKQFEKRYNLLISMEAELCAITGAVLMGHEL